MQVEANFLPRLAYAGDPLLRRAGARFLPELGAAEPLLIRISPPQPVRFVEQEERCEVGSGKRESLPIRKLDGSIVAE